jgi:hypothetical protein
MGVESERLTEEQMIIAVRVLSRMIAGYLASNPPAPEVLTADRSSKTDVA